MNELENTTNGTPENINLAANDQNTTITVGPTIQISPETTDSDPLDKTYATADPAKTTITTPKPPKLNRHAKRAMQARSRNKETKKIMERSVILASKIIKDVDAVKTWMATPSQSFSGNSPITMILMGNGDYVLDYLKRQYTLITQAEAMKQAAEAEALANAIQPEVHTEQTLETLPTSLEGSELSVESVQT